MMVVRKSSSLDDEMLRSRMVERLMARIASTHFHGVGSLLLGSARALVVCLSMLSSARAQSIDFQRDVRPILAEHCFHCHGPDDAKREAGLRLDLREAATAKLESDATAVVAGKPELSELVRRIRSTDADSVMPPPSTKKTLDPKQIKILEQWIAEGAPYAGHWAFRAPTKCDLPKIENGTAATNAIDALVAERLRSEGLVPAPPADAAALCRRLHLDLIGLPPSPQEVDDFVAAFGRGGDQAVDDLVKKLLASPRYGEHWARPWLDAARYADSNGFEKDLPREQWSWRDWVVDALNRDLPYNQFLIEQIAGDLLSDATQSQIVATGFLRNGMINEEGAIVPEQFRLEALFDRMDCLGKAVLGLSLQCCQCHSHKFDPISQTEYFGIFAYLNDAADAQSWVYTTEQLQKIEKLRHDIHAVEKKLQAARPEWRAELAAWEAQTRAQQVEWTPLKAVELGSTGGLNHPTQEVDLSVMTLGHPTTKGDIYLIAEPPLNGVTGLQLEALTHADLPFGGPGRSRYGTWAVSELEVSVKEPDQAEWTRLPLAVATADFEEPAAPLEEEWKAAFDPEHRRTRGPVAFIIDGDNNTGWRADRGIGRRNQEGVAVVRFEKPLDFPRGTQLKILLRMDHGDSGNGRGSVQLGRCRLSTTTAPQPRALPVDYRAVLALSERTEQRSEAQQSAIFTAWRTSRADCKSFNEEIDAIWKSHPKAGTSVLHLAGRDPLFARQTYLLDRGVWDRPKQEIAPHVPAALHPLPAGPPTDRLTFAKWLADPRSPLTARVAVNRVWQNVFGMGLVETSEDFGTRTPEPEYRKLLDWLAVDFVEHGWSQKELLRTIVRSRTYRQSSRAAASLVQNDPQNRLLARGPRYRADAEVVRDIALSAAGLIHHRLGGASIFPPVPESVLEYNYFKPTYWQPPTDAERYRRSVYVFRKRSMPDPVLSSFDAPNGDAACARRLRSNTPLSALTGLNETTFVEAAQALALRVLNESPPDDAARIDYAFRCCTGRAPSAAERGVILARLTADYGRLRNRELKANDIAFSPLTKLAALPSDATPNDVAAWTLTARVLLNLDETITKN
jgi:hypothetical protein